MSDHPNLLPQPMPPPPQEPAPTEQSAAISLLLRHGASVEFDDTFVDGDGNETHRPELGSWSLVWLHGSIRLVSVEHDAISQEDLTIMGALTIYLWLRGAPIDQARDLAYRYVAYEAMIELLELDGR